MTTLLHSSGQAHRLDNSGQALIRNNIRRAWRAYSDALRPHPVLSPSQFAKQFRVLHEIYCSENPGPWPDDKFPYQNGVMDAVQEAINTGKRGVVFMKAGQIGGTDCMIYAMLWLKVYFAGPQLFLTSTDAVAEEFGRERFELIVRDMPPLRSRYIRNKRGAMLVKRFSDGKIQLCGGQSVFKLQSTPYRIVVIDELDSLVENLGKSGDPLKLAEIRTNSFAGATLILAYAHPSTRDRGTAKLYFEQSDQRRGFITHAACGKEFWLDWYNVFKCTPRLKEQTQEQAEKDPDCYHLHCPHCNAVIDEAERVSMLRAGVVQKSLLPPEEAAKKIWIGVHASQLYTPHRTIREFAVGWIGCDCGRDDNATRVFVNKVLGEPYESKVKKVDISALRNLIVVKRRAVDPDFYSRGQVPAGVRFLTAGQDSRSTQLHYSVWGWGLRKTIDGTKSLCGWLIDWGEIARQYSLVFSDEEFHVFGRIIYQKRFPSVLDGTLFAVRAGGHDIGYEPSQLPVIRFCRSWPDRAWPVRGAAVTPTSASKAHYVKKGVAYKFKAGDTEAVDDAALILNTFMLKTDFYGWLDQKIEIADHIEGEIVGTRKVPRLTLPEDVDDLFLSQTSNEYQGKGKRGESIWMHKGPNHLADCNTYAYGAAVYLDPFQENLTAEEYSVRRNTRSAPPHARSRGSGRDPAMG